ncbi:ABC-2 type transport system permease protein [Clostridium tetanomorphum]|uniref:ABC transporter permease n=1 Tax=Clostridium tetanomorphum TaxID=1553 RepID=A0A923J2S9_CLOTT|nr:ABC transporter permease [Clostridium tetanomorphum]KAJ49033.1 membrane spanning protein [Clostridium tetanomorphum DSM 665]KAJ51725.1 membrane spanning protein [Clostridium tetanomorphum DSM 665]MBC2399100.1 ABC transporter permease [Clostridium tetanomorphum]MBP1865909.1 ABC-2 type transport system permease protein [Clostridium tetanomorphum]NRS86090.1 ABC-2 type transport system permease protein [Clostridium tetanomorphum]
MVEFKAAVINEVEKLYKKKKILVAVIVSLIFIVIGQLTVVGVRSGFGLRGASSMQFPILVLSVVVNTILPLFTALVTIDSFSGEFSQNTMKIAITRPITRLKFFTAKIVSIMLFILANLLFVMIFSIIAGIIFNSNSFTLQGLMRIVLCYIVTMIPMMILVLLIVTFTNMIRSGIGVFFLSILVLIIFKVLEIVFSQYSGIFFTSMFSWYNLWMMSSFPFLKILRQFMMMCSYGILLFTWGYYLFDKKDF